MKTKINRNRLDFIRSPYGRNDIEKYTEIQRRNLWIKLPILNRFLKDVKFSFK